LIAGVTIPAAAIDDSKASMPESII